MTGTGPGGRITRTDVEKAAGTSVGDGEDTPATREEPTKLRQAIAAAMSLSATVPQFSLERDVDVGELHSALRSRSPGPSSSLSLADAVGLATARAIARHPVFLRSWSDGAFEIRPSVNLGMAVAVEDGLIVPVLRDADALTLETFSQARRDLQERTLAGKLKAAESSGAVFTISNLGPLGVDRFRALVNPPESGILAVGRAREAGGRTILTLNLSADHRVVDGAQGARLLAEIARSLEDPDGRDELLGAEP